MSAGETHTPGPWMVGPINGGETYQITTAESRHFAVVAETPVDGTGRDEANARLIATAPDLLAAAKDALAGWRYIRATHGELYGVGWDRVEQALTAAISRASR